MKKDFWVHRYRDEKTNAVIPASTFHRMFHIQCGRRRGTAFSLDVHDRQYLITASHLLAPFQNQAPVELFHGGKWKPLDVLVVGVGPPQIDVAVLALKFRVTLPEFSLMPNAGSLTPGQTCYCLGFPLGERGGEKTAEQPFPIPFVKTVSVAHVTDPSGPIRSVFLDGYPNPGFSGGPVLVREAGKEELSVAAVVSAFHYEHDPIYVGTEHLTLNAPKNSDLILSYDIKHALDLITLNPMGFELTA